MAAQPNEKKNYGNAIQIITILYNTVYTGRKSAAYLCTLKCSAVIIIVCIVAKLLR
jgi:hypothetical protein